MIGLPDLLRIDDPENLKRDLRVREGGRRRERERKREGGREGNHNVLFLYLVLLPVDRPVARQPVHHVPSYTNS